MGRRILLFLIIPLIAVMSCSDESDLPSVTIGDNFIKPQTSIALIDTFSLKLSTMLIDSIATSSPANLLVGKYSDEFLGKTDVKGYFQLTIPASTEIEDKSVFDSLTLVLRYGKFAYGDTLQPQTINVHRVSADIEKPDDSYMYNTSKTPYDPIPIGSLTFLPRPNYKDSIEIRLDDKLGKDLMKMLEDEADEISDAESFLKFFKGIVLVGAEGNTSVLGFKTADTLVNVVLHTHYVKEERVKVRHKWPLYTSGIYYNNFNFDRTGTLVENLRTQSEAISSVNMGDKAFIQSGAGIVARLDFTGLEKIMEMGNRSFFYKAELLLRPFPGSYSQINYPDNLNLYKTDKYNRLVSILQNSEKNNLTPDFFFDKQYNENTYYRFDITSYLNDELSDGYFDPNNGLIITMPSTTLQGSLERLVLDARRGASFRPVLNLYFVFYE
jgi:hypothetical protein